jgi:5-oxoprolinase (ATP-hydrolysing)
LYCSFTTLNLLPLTPSATSTPHPSSSTSTAHRYYETIAGGAGAGPTWHGRSGVHTHMTNTRITDPEILERRYPVMLREFGLRAASGGAGRHRGGDGCVRELEFVKDLTLSLLSERRALAPNGLEGGGDGARGANHLHLREGRVVNLGGKSSVQVRGTLTHSSTLSSVQHGSMAARQ